MVNQILTSELDFDTLKASIKAYLQQHEEFSDYDFDASGLNILLDVLAYNTHQMALISNFTLNESFLDSAQIRSSLVSLSKALGYTPRSKTAPSATIDVAALSVPDGTATLTLPKYTQFTTTVDNDSYTYVNLIEYEADEDSDYIFEDVVVKEGKIKTKKFFIDGDDVLKVYNSYVIPDVNIDTSTISVLVRNGVGSSSVTNLTRATEVAELTSESNIYFLHEAPNGHWEISLGDNIVGVKPAEGTILEVTYLTTNGKDSNGAASFSTSATISGYSLSPTLVTRSSGGADKENIDSIRFNAPLSFAAQNRLVTVNDYKTFILNNTSYIESINIWEGKDNVPPEYGKVFISIKPTGADTITEEQQTFLEGLLAKKSVVDIRPRFVDPSYQYLDITCSIVYDEALATLNQEQLEDAVRQTIIDYGTNNLVSFGSVLRKSNLMTVIDDSRESILSSDIDIKVRKRFKPTLGALDTYEVPVTIQIQTPTSSTTPVVSSTGFTYTSGGVNYTVFLRNKTNSTQLEIFRISGSSEVIVVDNAGSIDIANKKLTIGPIQPTAFLNADKGIELIITPNDDATIRPLRNTLLIIDEDAIAVSSTADES